MNFVYFDGNQQDFKFIKGNGSLNIVNDKASVKPPSITKSDVYVPPQDIFVSGTYTLCDSNWSDYVVSGFVQFSIFNILNYYRYDWKVTLNIDGDEQMFDINNKLSPNVIIPINCVKPSVIMISCTVPFVFKAGNVMYNVLLTS